jgi:transposase-like protein
MHPKSGPRRRHSDELKAKVVAACDEPGASISGVALAHGLNTLEVNAALQVWTSAAAPFGSVTTSGSCRRSLLPTPASASYSCAIWVHRS